MMRSLRARLLILAAVWIFAALLAAFLVIGYLLDHFVSQRFDAELQNTADALIADLQFDGDQLTLTNPPTDPRFQIPLSGWYWQITQDGAAVLKSPSLFDAKFQTVRLNMNSHFGRGPNGEPLRVLTQDITVPGLANPLIVTVTAPAREIGESLAEFAARWRFLWRFWGWG